ncbi:hypothetical protein [Pseudarthrobacter sulfonivorans]|uniref:hypothetical protein n=1 Tax=Pseudarthrobacter sulfonivorans TaxID=121292 RepID=UPI0028621393|nr:hypothetical protein [Pseudarthrobacter sulfonivorans]MDR6415263.1 hypothetical protein [Pseudarthrobacter sulfonivorans]
MTENQWPEALPSTSLDQYGNPVPATPATATPSGPQGVSASKTEAAKTESAEVAGQAAGAAKDVAEIAKVEAANVASEVKTNARDLLHQAKSDLTSQAGTQQQKVASGLRSVSEELHAMARASDQPGLASDLVRQAADRSQSVASWLDGRDPGSLLNEVKSFARQRPGTFLLLAAGAGVLAGRLTKGLAAGAPEAQGPSGRAYPPAPRTAPAQQGGPIRQETVFAAGDDRGLFEEPVIATGRPVSAHTLPTGAPGDVPLREDDDPFRNTAGRDAEGRHL